MLSKGNFRCVILRTDNVSQCEFSGGACLYGTLWQFMRVFCFSSLTLFQPQFNNKPKPWEAMTAGKKSNYAMILCMVCVTVCLTVCVHAGTQLLCTNTLRYFDGLVCVAVWASKISDAKQLTGVAADIEDLHDEHETEVAQAGMGEAIRNSKNAFWEDA